jgi:hypothetical protein
LYRAGPVSAPATTEIAAKPNPIAPSAKIGTYGFDVDITNGILEPVGRCQ